MKLVTSAGMALLFTLLVHSVLSVGNTASMGPVGYIIHGIILFFAFLVITVFGLMLQPN